MRLNGADVNPPVQWDCHTHVYGPWESFPLPPDAAYRPAEAPMTQLLALHSRLGISRGVLVQAACYRGDHSALLAALHSTGGRYRGVALIDGDTDEASLQALHNGGVRGIRFNFMGHLPGERNLVQLRQQAERVRQFGWHVLLHGQIGQLLPVLDAWHDLDVPLVIDHMARVNGCLPLDEDALGALQRHLERDKRWIKLSGVDRVMQGAPGPWEAALPLARRLLQAAQGRAIWGSDWPHPNIQGAPPEEPQLLEFIRAACGNTANVEAVMCGNPQILYT
ncbi:MAG: amidohydrolase family protein [Herbaspirillum sp.]|nr:amidohydrolase family protein [Herbaspirillum sp.]